MSQDPRDLRENAMRHTFASERAQERDGQTDWEPEPSRACPYCDRIMSEREKAEQGACNDCAGGAR